MKNDKTIMKLREQIEEKEKALNGLRPSIIITNCMLTLDGQNYNLNVLKLPELIHLYVKLTCYIQTADYTELLEDYEIGGFNIVDWVDDVYSKMVAKKLLAEKIKLTNMKARLMQLLSAEKQTELEIDAIAAELGI
jgi:hypothetical protein